MQGEPGQVLAAVCILSQRLTCGNVAFAVWWRGTGILHCRQACCSQAAVAHTLDSSESQWQLCGARGERFARMTGGMPGATGGWSTRVCDGDVALATQARPVNSLLPAAPPGCHWRSSAAASAFADSSRTGWWHSTSDNRFVKSTGE